MIGREFETIAKLALHDMLNLFRMGCETISIMVIVDLTVDSQLHPSQHISHLAED